MDPYQSCPCGSGKGVKWCCQALFSTVEKARAQQSQGQHETALRTMRQLVEQNPRSAPALGYEAEFLYTNGRANEADEAIQKAFAIDPQFPLGHWLRGLIRRDERELVGALLEFRKAADLYDPKAVDILAEVYSAIFDIEMRMNRPVAARAVLERAVRLNTADGELRKAFDGVFGPESPMPASARKAYSLRTAEAGQAAGKRFGDLLAAAIKLTSDSPNNSSTWFDLGLVHAWRGDNPLALEELLRSIEMEIDEGRRTEAVALTEVLRFGDGMQNQADYLEHRVFFQFQQAQPAIDLLESLSRDARLTRVQQDEQNGTISGLILEEPTQFGLGIGTPMVKMGAYVLIFGNYIRLWHPNKDSVGKIADEIAGKLAGTISPAAHDIGFGSFIDVASETTLFPIREIDVADAKPKIVENAQSYFEETWLNRSLKSLGGLTPAAATESSTYRKRLPGVVQFQKECFELAAPEFEDGQPIYDFSRLRRKLRLDGAAPASVSAAAVPKFDELSVAELAGLEGVKLSDEELEQAFRAAVKHDARELAGSFARLLVNRPANAQTPDRYPYFMQLIQLAQAENDLATVMSLLDHAEKTDAESNGGLRHADYALRRAQTHAKRGEAETAYEVLKSLLSRYPDELKYYGPATEAMLGQKKGQWAAEFAEAGLTKARSQNNRDVEQYLMELAAAAKKQM